MWAPMSRSSWAAWVLAVVMAAPRWWPFIRVWVMIRALAPTVTGSWLAWAARMLRSAAR